MVCLGCLELYLSISIVQWKYFKEIFSLPCHHKVSCGLNIFLVQGCLLLAMKSQRVVNLCNYLVVFLYNQSWCALFKTFQGFPIILRKAETLQQVSQTSGLLFCPCFSHSLWPASPLLPTPLYFSSSPLLPLLLFLLSLDPCTFSGAIVNRRRKGLLSVSVACSQGCFYCLLNAHHTLWSVVLSTAVTFLLAYPITVVSLCKVTHDGCPLMLGEMTVIFIIILNEIKWLVKTNLWLNRY